MIETIRWLISIALLLVSAYFIVTNFRFLLANFRLGLNAGPAPMTIMGGLAGCLGLLLLPYMDIGDRLSLLWIPLLLDLGCLPFYFSLALLTLCQALGLRLWKTHPDYAKGDNQ